MKKERNREVKGIFLFYILLIVNYKWVYWVKVCYLYKNKVILFFLKWEVCLNCVYKFYFVLLLGMLFLFDYGFIFIIIFILNLN